jgi:hypothetical protein
MKRVVTSQGGTVIRVAVLVTGLLLARGVPAAESLKEFADRIAMFVVNADDAAIYHEFGPEGGNRISSEQVATIGSLLRSRFGRVQSVQLYRVGHGEQKSANGQTRAVEVVQYRIKTDRFPDDHLLQIDATQTNGRYYLLGYQILERISGPPAESKE